MSWQTVAEPSIVFPDLQMGNNINNFIKAQKIDLFRQPSNG